MAESSRSMINPDEDNVRAPPELDCRLPTPKNIKLSRYEWSSKEIQSYLPTDILLVTAADYEFNSCYSYMKQFRRSWCQKVGIVDFGEFGDQHVKAALIRSQTGSLPALTVVSNATEYLKPKVVLFVGICATLNRAKAKLGDVLISANVVTSASRKVNSDGTTEHHGIKVNTSRNMARLIVSAADGWQPPLKEPSSLDVRIHRQAVMLSGSELIDNYERRQELLDAFPDAIGLEMENEGLYLAVCDLGIEWAVIKGVSDYADESKMATEDWQSFASTMAVSVVYNMFQYADVLKHWPRYNKPGATEGDDNKEYKSTYLKAIGRKISQIPIMVIGEAMGGTASLMKKLFGLLFNKDQPSTKGAQTRDDSQRQPIRDSVRAPPELNWFLPPLKDVGCQRYEWSSKEIQSQLPTDILLVTATDHEFKSCYSYMKQVLRSCCPNPNVGIVDFGNFGDEHVKAALIRSQTGEFPALIVVNNATEYLKPKVVLFVGVCATLNQTIAQLGDVMISANLVTSASRKVTSDGTTEHHGIKLNARRNMARLILSAADGWQPPLKEASSLNVTIHRQAVILSSPELVDNDEQRQELLDDFPDAIGLDMAGEGLYSAAYDLGIEWAVIKGVSDYANGSKKATEDWQAFASTMAASVVYNMFQYADVLKHWPHYNKPGSTEAKHCFDSEETLASLSTLQNKDRMSLSHNPYVTDKKEPDKGNCYEVIRTLANQFVEANPSCIAAVPCHTKFSGAETTPDIVVYLYIHTSGMRITDNFREEATKIFFPYTVEFVDLKREPLGGSYWPRDHEEENEAEKRNDAKKMAKMARCIVKNLSIFKNCLNVTAVYPSYKISSGVETNDLCVAVAVLGKGKVPVGERVFPESVVLDDYYKIDVVEGYFIPTGLEYSEEEIPLRFGAGIGVRDMPGAGSLGALVTDGQDYFVLSCNHVLYKLSEEGSGAEGQGDNEGSGIIKYLKRELSDVNSHMQKLEQETKDPISEEQTMENQRNLEKHKKLCSNELSGSIPCAKIVHCESMSDEKPDEKLADEKSADESPGEEKPNKGKFVAEKLLSDDERCDKFLAIKCLKNKIGEIKNRMQQLEQNCGEIDGKKDDLKELRDRILTIKVWADLEEIIAENPANCRQNEGKISGEEKAEILIEQPSGRDYVMQVIDLEKKSERLEVQCSGKGKDIEAIDDRRRKLETSCESGKIAQLEKTKQRLKEQKDCFETNLQECISKLERLRKDKIPRCIAKYIGGFQDNYYDSNLERSFFVDAGIAKLFDIERDIISTLSSNPTYTHNNEQMNFSNEVVSCADMEQGAQSNTFWKCGRTTGVTKGATFSRNINVKSKAPKIDDPIYGRFHHKEFSPICKDCPKFSRHTKDTESTATVCKNCGKDIPANEIRGENWALNCFMLEHTVEFTKPGDSGAVVFDEKKGNAYAMVVGAFRRGPIWYTITSSLNITLKALNERLGKKLSLCIKKESPENV